MSTIERFEENLLTSGQVIDPDGVHSEFVSGMHGQKIDFDKLGDQDPLYDDWVNVNVDFLNNYFPNKPVLLLGVANGTNRLVHDVAKARGSGLAIALESEKDKQNSKILRLTPLARLVINSMKPNIVVELEDVGTTGSNSVQVAQEANEAGAGKTLVVVTWQRRPQLELLEKAGIEYVPLIHNPLPTFSPEDCAELPEGFCARDWEFKARQK